MPRQARLDAPGTLHHVMIRGIEGANIFGDDKDREHFLSRVGEIGKVTETRILAWALMDYHLILETPKGNLLKVMHGLNGRYTGYFNRKYGRAGHLFQGRYRGIIIDKDSYLIPLSRYVHLNPVRARVVERPEHYRWSSYRGYIGREKECGWIEYSWVLPQFGRYRNGARRKYKKYTEEALKSKVENPLERLHGQVILGREEFINRVKGMFKGGPLSQEILERKRLEQHPALDGVLKLTAKAFKIDEDSIRDRGIRANTARKVALYFAKRYTGLGNEQIAQSFGGIHYSAVSKAYAKLKEEMSGDKKLSNLVDELDSQFKT